jgi:hypothetical protein
MIRLTKWDKGCFFLEGLQNKAKLSGYNVMIENILMHRFLPYMHILHLENIGLPRLRALRAF